MNISGEEDIPNQTQRASNQTVNLHTMASPRSSYAQATQSFNCPKKEQAIVIDSVEGVTIKDYTLAIGNIVGPNNIRFVSRISQGRVCLYLNSQTTVDRLIEAHNKINVNNHHLEVRPLISKAKRIILSNVCPVIPNSLIEDKLKALKVATKSQISYIKAGISDPSYSHILSFRRQVYIEPEDINKLPEAIQISFDNTLYWIYVSTDKLSCFLCKEEGHLAKFCKNIEQQKINNVYSPTENSNFPSIQSTSMVEPDKNSLLPADELLKTKNNSDNVFKVPITNRGTSNSGVKRSHSITSSTNNDTQEPNDINESSNKSENATKKYDESIRQAKKIIKVSPTNKNNEDISAIKEQLKPVKLHISNSIYEYPLEFETLANFINESYRNRNVDIVALKYTNNLTALIDMLDKVTTYVHGNLKNRILRIIKKLRFPGNDGTSSDDLSSSEDH